MHPSRIGCSLLAIDCLNEQSITSVNPVSILRTTWCTSYSYKDAIAMAVTTGFGRKLEVYNVVSFS